MADMILYLEAQARDFARARRELAAGRKTSHWMWYVFPQLASLGLSGASKFHGLANLAEARSYWEHPVLGPRLVEMARLMLTHEGRSAEEILGYVDTLKLRSSMTLFASLPGAAPEFAAVLDAFYGGERCLRTEMALAAQIAAPRPQPVSRMGAFTA